MTPAYKAHKTHINDLDNKYFKMGYDCFVSNIGRDLADDLCLIDRASFLKGWDTAQHDFLTKCPASRLKNNRA